MISYITGVPFIQKYKLTYYLTDLRQKQVIQLKNVLVNVMKLFELILNQIVLTWHLLAIK